MITGMLTCNIITGVLTCNMITGMLTCNLCTGMLECNIITVCLFGNFRPTREFYSHIETSVRATNYDMCSALMAIEQWHDYRHVIVQHYYRYVDMQHNYRHVNMQLMHWYVNMQHNYSLFLWGFLSHSTIFLSYGDLKGLQILTCARHSWPLSNEGCLAYHTYCDMGHPFIMVICEDSWHSHLLLSV